MFRSRYDGDAGTFSPEGRILQVDNAIKAVQQGMPTVAIRSSTHAVVAAVMHAPTEFSSFQPKLFKIDEHIGLAISGLTADGRGLCKLLRNECLQHRFAHGTEAKAIQLADLVARKSQSKTQSSGKRPYGVGLLLIGVGPDGPRLFETCPSGQHWEYNAQAIGRRAQAGKTYLEQHFSEFPNATRDELIRHVLRALGDCKAKDETTKTTAIALAIVGVDEPFTILDADALTPYIEG
jgi:20S proteasome subunit alpha 6